MELADRLKAFQRTYPYREIALDGVVWCYRMGGVQNASTVLLLPGATLVPDPFFIVIESLGRSYQVIAPAYPPVRSMAELVAGVTGNTRCRRNPDRARRRVVVRWVSRSMLGTCPSRAGKNARSSPDWGTPFHRLGATYSPPVVAAGITGSGRALVHVAHVASARRPRARPAILDRAAEHHPQNGAVEGEPNCDDGCDRRLHRPLPSDGGPFGQAGTGAAIRTRSSLRGPGR